MAQQIICNIEMPEVGISYISDSKEALLQDRLVAAELSLITLAKHIREVRSQLWLPCPHVVSILAASDEPQAGP